MSWRGLGLAILVLVGCGRRPSEPLQQEPSESAAAAPRTSTPPEAPTPSLPFRYPAPERLVAIGDLHGDLAATRAALRLAGAINEEDDWIGGKLVVVQTGDQLDRGDDERAILDLLEKLETRAAAQGGMLLVINGNHETMTVAGDFRYATPGGNAGFADLATPSSSHGTIGRFPTELRGRAAAFMPGGPYAKQLAKRPVVAIVGDTVFAHGGVLPEHVRYGLGRLNDEVSRWMAGLATMPAAIAADQAPVWTRAYGGTPPEPAACAWLAEVHRALGTRRLVVGHTIQEAGINAACDGAVWRIDVALSRYYGTKPPEVLEITARGPRVLNAATQSSPRTKGAAPRTRAPAPAPPPP